MVTPPASSKPRLLEKVAGSTLMLCHAFPQERPTGRSGTASAGGGKSAEAEVPSFSRNGSCSSAVFSPPVRRRFYQLVKALSIWHRRRAGALAGRLNLGRGVLGDTLRRCRCGCYTHRLVCRKANLLSIDAAASRRRRTISETHSSHAATINNPAQSGGLTRAITAKWQAVPRLDNWLPDE